MNKRLTSLLLCFVMVFAMLVTAVPTLAAPITSTQIKVIPDKTTAAPGDVITYTIVLGPVSDFGAMQMVLNVPTGLTYVANSGKIADNLKTTLGFDLLDWTEASIRDKNDSVYPGCMLNGGASAADYESTTDTTLATFKCKVDDGASGNLSVGLYKLEFGSCITFEYLTERFSVVETPVTITAAPKPATGIELNKNTTTIYTGNSETLTATVTPSDSTDTVEWSSNKTDVATVDNTGKVTAVAPGKATITAKAGDKTATCTVKVENAPCTHSSKSTVTEKSSTCKDKGWDAYQKCNNCDKIFDMSGNIISGIPYRALAGCQFTKEEVKEAALKTAGTCKDEAVYIKSCAVCGKVDTNTNNTFLGAKNPSNHAGGTYLKNNKEATCKAEGYTGDTYCRGCDTKLSDGTVIGKSGHNPASVWSHNGTKHWKECTNVVGCGVKLEEGNHISTGENVATCQHKAVCDVCGVPYGGLADHSYSTAWSNDATKHWHACTVCGDKKDEDTHVFDQEVATPAYKATDATCTAKATYYKSCKCGEKGTETFEYGTTPGHSEGTEWKFDADNHWHICTVAGCGVVIESSKAAHTPDREAATVNDPIKCRFCGYEIAPRIEIVKVELPFTVTVKQGGNVAPGKQAFELEIFGNGNSNETEYADVTCTATVETNGKGDYNAKLVIAGPEDRVYDFCCEGFYVREKNTKVANWTYSDAVWYVSPVGTDEGLEYILYPATLKTTDNGEYYEFDREHPAEKMTFENTYTENKTVDPTDPTESGNTKDPKTGDSNNMILWIALLFVSGGVFAGTTVYSRKRKSVK